MNRLCQTTYGPYTINYTVSPKNKVVSWGAVLGTKTVGSANHRGELMCGELLSIDAHVRRIRDHKVLANVP